MWNSQPTPKTRLIKLSILGAFVGLLTTFQVWGAAVEEGWRYRDTFHVNILNQGVVTQIDQASLENIHSSMSYTIDTAKREYADSRLPKADSRNFALFRFTPILRRDDEGHVVLGKTIFISNMVVDQSPEPLRSSMTSSFESVFVSGFFSSQNNPDMQRFMTRYTVNYEPAEARSGAFTRLPPLVATSIPYTFLMRDYIEPSYLSRALNFRYPEVLPQGSILKQEAYSRIRDVHKPTKQELPENDDYFDGMTDEAKKEIGQNDKANHYACAEQVGLDFISNKQVIDYLRASTEIDKEDVLGVIVHLHTSQNPCGKACATSLARECEQGGLFRRIFNGKPVQLINTISEFYERPANCQLPYGQTRCADSLLPLYEVPKPIEFSLITSIYAPYPVILYQMVDPARGYSIPREAYDLRPE